MNKILITLFISMFLPVYACPVDSDKPCTGENQDTQIISKIDNFAMEQNDNPKEYPSLPENERAENPQDVQNQSYDPDCMFGVCLP